MYNDPGVDIKVTVNIPHDKSDLLLNFTSNLDESASRESFGFSNVKIIHCFGDG